MYVWFSGRLVVVGMRTLLLCWRDSGTRGLMRRESSCFVGGILNLLLCCFWFGGLGVDGWLMLVVGSR